MVRLRSGTPDSAALGTCGSVGRRAAVVVAYTFTAQIREVERSTLSREELEPRVRRLVADMGERGAVNIVGLDGRAHMRLTSRASNPAEVLAWLFPEETVQRLLSSVPEGGTTSDERSAKLASLNEKLDKLERQEAALVVASGANWRKGISGAAILSIEVRS